ncbi:MAG: WYL domain-containing protein [Chitinophagaceae bacterium]|nr:MAG: WYL domain-containing protein [Chitinophagaceae bacterium]
MPLNKDALTRYRLIDERLRNHMVPKPSLDQLLVYVSDKMEKTVSRRTILLDIKNMKDSTDLNYKAPIEFDHYQKGYYYSDTDYSINNMPVTEYELQGLEIAIGILRQFNNLPVIRQFEDAILKIADSVNINKKKQEQEQQQLIHLDAPPRYKGLEWIPEIANAIGSREILRIRYQSFDRKEPKEYRIEPYHLREYNNRFYVFAKSTKETKPGLRTFGLDRIIDIWPTDQHFDEKNFDETGYFKNVIGITVSPDEKPQKVILSFTPQQGKYIKAQPLHQSQRIIRDDNQECRVSLHLVLNTELIMVLLSYGSKVKVLQPKSLAEKIMKEALEVKELYE